MVIPDLFYSEDYQTQQLSPISLEDGQYFINNIIYPTLGNPNLYHTKEPSDELLIVLRLQNEYLNLLMHQILYTLPIWWS